MEAKTIYYPDSAGNRIEEINSSTKLNLKNEKENEKIQIQTEKFQESPIDLKEKETAKKEFEDSMKSEEKWVTPIKETAAENIEEDEDRSPIYVKILYNYIQIIAILGSFQFNWPDQLTELFEYNKNVISATQEFFSMDCFLKK